MSDIWNNLTDAVNRGMAIDEMRLKYKDTVLLIKKPGGSEVLAYYRGYDDNFHYFKDEHDVDIKLRHETECEVICKFPERRLFNHGKLALEFIRLPTRQNKRGICKDTCRIYSPVRQLWSIDAHPWTLTTVRDALFPKYPVCFEEALKELFNKNVASVALNEKFMVTLSFTNKPQQYPLFYCNKLIGYFEGDTVYIKHPLFKQEVLDNISLFKPFKIGY